MRLDKYLKITRLIKRRTVANEACDGGRILVNGKVARASYAVKEGDTIETRWVTAPSKYRCCLSANMRPKKVLHRCTG